MMKFNLNKWDCIFPLLDGNDLKLNADLLNNCSFGVPELPNIPPLVKRRLPVVAKAMAHLDNKLDAHTLPAVYASKDAELSRTLKLIRQFDQDLSPAMFSMSVNNALPGLLSVINENRLPYTVIDSMSGILAMAFLEASTMLHEYPKVKVMVFEEQSIPEFAGDSSARSCYAFGFVLSRGESLTVQLLPLNNKSNFSGKEPVDYKDWVRFFNKDQQQMTQVYPRQQWQWNWS